MLALLAKFAPAVLGKVADCLIPGAGSVVQQLHQWYLDKREATEKAEIRKALRITEEKLNVLDNMFMLLGRDCLQLLERVDALEKQGQDAADEIAREVLNRPELQSRFDAIGAELAKLDGRVSLLEADVKRLDERYASLGAYAGERANQLSETELADFREFRKAKQFQAAGQFAESEPILLKLANTQPKSAAVAVAQAVARHDDPANFERSIRRAVKLRPDDDVLKRLVAAATVAVTRAHTPSASPTKPAVRVPQVGDTLDGWLLESRLGGGGWGIVFRATKRGLSRALKVMRPDLSTREEFVEAFQTEAFKLNRLRHANVVAVERNGYCTAHHCHYFVMLLLDGMNLEQHLAAHGVPSADVAMGWLTGLLDGLEHAHANGLIHRDIKPQNVMVQPDGTAVLIDFGIAGLEGVPGETQAIGVSKFYAPPELHSLGEADARADLFMLAATLFYGLRYDQPLRERAWNKFKPDRVPEVFRPALAEALNADEEARPEDVSEMRKLLEARVAPGTGKKRQGDWKSTCEWCASRLLFSEHQAEKYARCPKCSMKLLLPRSSGETATLSAGDSFELPLPGGVAVRFSWCPPGKFLMGSPVTELDRERDEVQHEVVLTHGFFIGVHPVTQSQWSAVNSTNPSVYKGVYNPAESVSWDDAVAFCEAVTRVSGSAVRLPTEAEWEYAARGKKKSAFHWGSRLNGTQANCDGRKPYGTDREGPFLQTTMPVGSYDAKSPQPWGLTDVHGNVWEWCADFYDEAFYSRSPKVDPLCTDGEAEKRVIRGGSWMDDARVCRAAKRYSEVKTRRNSTLGFRIVLSKPVPSN